MCQYTPLGGLDNYPELNRRVTKREYEKLLDFAVELGVVERLHAGNGKCEKSSYSTV